MSKQRHCLDCGKEATFVRCLGCHAVNIGRELCQFCDKNLSTKGMQACYDCHVKHKVRPCIDCGGEAAKNRCLFCHAVFKGREICSKCKVVISSEGKDDCRKCFRLQKYGNQCHYCGNEKGSNGKCFPCDADADGRYVCETCYLDYAIPMLNQCEGCYEL